MKKKAQNLSEYAIMLGVIIGAVLVSQDMVKKALIGKIRDGSKTLSSVRGKIGDDLTGVSFGDSESTDPVKQFTNTDSRSGKQEEITNGMAQNINATSNTSQTIIVDKLY